MSWIKIAFPIASIFSFRMFGLFMLIPVFTLYAGALEGSTPRLIGVALGIYGLSQGLLQIPCGLLSDRWGRKPVLTLGLLLFALGSLWGAQTHSIWGMIFARTLQGTGAIGSVLIALLADLTSEKERSKAMAVIGMTIGISFALAMILSPAITSHFGLAGIFYLTTGLAILGLLMLYTVIPSPQRESYHADAQTNPSLIKTALKDWQLQRLNISIFFQHAIFTGTFYALPQLLEKQILLGNLKQATHFYIPLLVISFVGIIPLIIIGEKRGKTLQLLSGAIALTLVAQAVLLFTQQHWLALVLTMTCYLIAFNFLEATLPSLISKQAKPFMKGTALGVYSTTQFLGIFVGGSLAGILFSMGGISAILAANSLFALVWLLIINFLPSSISPHTNSSL